MNTSPLIALSLLIVALTSCTALPLNRTRPALGATAWTSFDGKQMPWASWRVPKGTEERAVMITIHGLSGAMSDFWLLADRLPAQGVSVYGYEVRGQGHDSEAGKRGDIDDAELWLRDLLEFHQLVRARHRGKPIIWYGESLGSLIALHSAAKHRRAASPDALILASPVAGLRMPLSEIEHFLLRSSSRLLPTLRVKLGDLAGMDESKIRVTSVSTHGEQMAKTPHHVEAFTLRLLREMDDLMQDNKRAAHRIEVPVLMLGSPHDIVSSPDQVQALFKELDTDDKLLHWYSRSYHLLLHDVQREDVVKDVSRWVKRVVK